MIMTLNSFSIKDSYWSSVLFNVKDNVEIVYALSLDALIKYADGESLKVLGKILEKHYCLTTQKMEGISLALIEYQTIRIIPEEIISSLQKIIESRMFDDDIGEEKVWIKNILSLISKQFSNNNYRWLISALTNDNRRVPQTYEKELMNVVETYVTGYGKNPAFQSRLKNDVKRFKERLLIVTTLKTNEDSVNIRKLRLKLIDVLSAPFPVFSRIKIKLTDFRFRINMFVLELTSNVGLSFTIAGATSVIPALLGYWLMPPGGVYYFPAAYMCLCIVCILILRQKYKPELTSPF